MNICIFCQKNIERIFFSIQVFNMHIYILICFQPIQAEPFFPKKKTHKYICFVFQPKRQSRQSAWQKVYFSSFRFVGKSFSPTRRKVCNIMYVSVYVSILWNFFLYFTSSSLSSFDRPFGNLHCRKWCNTRFRTFG